MTTLAYSTPEKFKEFDLCYDEIKNGINDKLKTSNIIMIMMRTMEVVEKYKYLNGTEKRELVMRIMIKLVEDLEKDEENEEALKLMINVMGPNLIDSVILASKGKFEINPKKCTISCCIQ